MTKPRAVRYQTKAAVKDDRASLAREVAAWDAGRRSHAGFVDAPGAVPRAGEAIAISLRIPSALLEILRRFAEREGIGYQVLMKRWLDDRVRVERERERQLRAGQPIAPVFPLVDRAGRDLPHFERG